MPLMNSISQDIRHSIRGLSRTPAFTAIAVGTVALGIAAVTSMFTVASAALVRPLPFEDPGELYELRKVQREAIESVLRCRSWRNGSGRIDRSRPSLAAPGSTSILRVTGRPRSVSRR